MRSTAIAVFVCVAVLSACKDEQPEVPAASTPLALKATTAQLMNWILDPQADIVWAQGGTIVTPQGEQRILPKTDDEWNALRNAAATVAESANLLLFPPHIRDQGDWVAMTRKAVEKANECVAAAEAKDIDTLFTAASDMYLACTACHAKYVIGVPLSPDELPK
jgi:hypothetical protein